MLRKPKPKATAPTVEATFTEEQTPDQARTILWQIARNPEQSGTARVSALRILLLDFRERGDGVEGTRHDVDLDRRARALMRRVAN